MEEINIRPAIREDVPAIVSMLADDELGKTREDFQDPLPQDYNQAFSKISKDPNQELMVVVDNRDKVIGTLQLSLIPYLTYRGGTRAQIEAVRIHRDYRGQGIGKIVFEWCIARAQAKGAHVVQLTTDKKRPEAIRFYEELGFRASHEGMKLHL